MVPAETTKLTLKYDPLEMVNESVVAHAWMVSRTVLVELLSHNSVVVALLLSHPVRSVGGIRTPSHVPHEAVIITQLTLIAKVLLAEPVETIFNVHVLVKVTPVAVAHHIFDDHVVVVVHATVNTTVATADHVLPAKSLKLNV